MREYDSYIQRERRVRERQKEREREIKKEREKEIKKEREREKIYKEREC